MSKKVKQFADQYTVINGCNTSDDTRYEIGDPYFPGNHPAEDTAELIAMNCLEEYGD